MDKLKELLARRKCLNIHDRGCWWCAASFTADHRCPRGRRLVETVTKTITAAASVANRGRLSLAWAARMQQNGKQNDVPYLDGLTELIDEERRAIRAAGIAHERRKK